ncbi:hypothetical protein TRFO_01107 [Tritrichomonas foetus]|uniref:DnaK protein n=1 Tax=Tritrichomonas foetus TaxID=1144522 RepID=A0A1J4KNA6_9EUKA|nr:hypothetical protein TRFO_01107 [Tritrichomonas foetus]|eukprot:OHT11182.1 hypothetical protein TRFO_01107 [Tritrichomonas foetus]
MLISFFFTFSLSVFAAIDLGSQYVRIAVSSIKDPVSMAINEDNKVMTPSAIAFKLPKYTGKHMTMEEASKSEIKIGENALKFLKNKKDSGVKYLPRLIGRTFSSDYEIPPILNTTEMLALFFKKILSHPQYSSLEAVSINIPNYYTLSQRECILEAINISSIPIFGLLDDVSAIIQLYTIMYSKRFIYESHSVLFVDIGASAVRAYRIVFTQNETDPLGTQTSYEWTEKTGGLEFVRKVAQFEKCSMSKAQKLLIQGIKDYSHLFEEDLEIIYDLIHVAVDGEVDEVQLIGGASRFPFVVDCIKNVVGYTDVLRDLPQMNTIALGSLHIMHSTVNQSRYKLVPVLKPPYFTSVVECGSVEQSYCKLREKCSSYTILQGAICKTVSIIAKSEVPEGASKVLGQFDMVNITNFQHEIDDSVSALLVMKEPAPYISSAMWCKNGKRFCQEILVKATINEDPLKKRKEAFVERIWQENEWRVKKSEFRARISQIYDRIISMSSNQEDKELSQILENAQKIIEGEIDLSLPDMRQFVIKLEKKAKDLKINMNEL